MLVTIDRMKVNKKNRIMMRWRGMKMVMVARAMIVKC